MGKRKQVAAKAREEIRSGVKDDIVGKRLFKFAELILKDLESQYLVHLKSVGNPDYHQNPFDSISPEKMKPCYTLKLCQEAVLKYIADHDLGGGNWAGGDVFKNKKRVAYISYNGKIHPPRKPGEASFEKPVEQAAKEAGPKPDEPPGPMRTTLSMEPSEANQNRAEWARVGVEAFRQETHMSDEDLDTVIGDLVCDLWHLCRVEKIDFKNILERAERGYEEELDEERMEAEEEEEGEDEEETLKKG